MPDVPENNLPLTADGDVQPPSEADDGGCFAPFVPPVPVPPAPKPAPKPKPPSLMPLIDRILADNGCVPAPTDAPPETEVSVPAAAGGTDDEEMTQPTETLSAPAVAPLPPPRIATADELFTWIKRCVLAQTHLPADAAELIAFWVISTYFQDVLTVLPCLIITGPAHDAGVVLHLLYNLCRRAALLAGFRRSDLGVLSWGCQTNLISEPNLDKRTVALLSSMTDRNCSVVDGQSLIKHAKSTAIYAGENPITHKILNSIHIHISPSNSAPPTRPAWLQTMMERLPVHLDLYRKMNLSYVKQWTWVPFGVSSETAAIATALARGIVDAPELRQKLLTLLQVQDRQQLYKRSGAPEALVVEAVLALSRQDRLHAYTSEVAGEANRILELRGERLKLSPETVGRRLCQLGLRTCRLTLAGNGLTFDKATVALIQQLAVVYVEEDLLAQTENLHDSQTTGNKKVEEVEEVV